MKNNRKRIELFTMKGCDPCDDALNALIPFTKEHGIPLTITPVQSFDEEPDAPDAVPMTCVIKERGGITVRKCVKGFDENLLKDVEELLDTL